VAIHSVDKKLRESRFFLDRMRECERVPSRYWEPFDFFPSEFLSATRTIDDRLRHEREDKYKHWRVAWNKKRTPADNALIKFMIDDRGFEVHEIGSSRDGSIDLHVKAPDLGASEIEPGAFFIPANWFTIQGEKRKVTDVCEQYLALLQAMVAQFLAENP
jgi:hypothetical protein